MSEMMMRLLFLLGLGVLIYYLYTRHFFRDLIKNEGKLQTEVPKSSPVSVPSSASDGKYVSHQLDEARPSCNEQALPYAQLTNNYGPAGQMTEDELKGLACFPKNELTAQELLPKENVQNTWTEVNPEGPGRLSDRNFLESGALYGINTVGQSLKNPNLQVRSDPLIPQCQVSPWLQSTIEPDTNRLPFEIGQCGQST